MENKYIFVEVAIPIPVFETYLYKLEKEKLKNLPDKELIGRRVLVPFKNTKTVGIIIDIKENLKVKNSHQYIRELINPKLFKPVSTNDELVRYIQSYSFKSVFIVDFEIKSIEDIPDKYPIYNREYIKIIKELSDYYVAPLGLSLYYGMPDVLRWKFITYKNRWEKKGINNYILYSTVENPDGYKLSEKQKELMEYIISSGEATFEELTELGFSPITIKSLINKGLLEKENLYFLEEKPSVFQKIEPFGKDLLKKGLFLYSSDSIHKRLKVYINIIANLIYEGKSSLIIFPNVASLKRAYKILKPIFGEKLYIYFDGLKGKEKLNTWFNLKNMKGLVCIGTFSSIFIPIKNLSLLVIEEEHSNSYKLMRTPRFDIRNFGYKLYQNLKDLSFILASSSPSVETVYLIERGLVKRFKNKNLLESIKSKIHITDFKRSEINERLKILLKNKDNVLILVNRKGFSSMLYCEVCDKEIKCERCDIPLKVHIKPERLECPICNTKYKLIKNCPNCDNKLIQIGFGIEKLEREIRKSYPHKNIDFQTTIIDKELLFKNYDTVINVAPDLFLNNADFKADEKFFRAITYPFIKSDKEYILITNQREHIGVKSLLKRNSDLFYKNELKKRKILNYPPYKQIILLNFEGKNLKKSDVEKLFKEWVEKFNLENIEYEGVYFAYYPYIRNRFRYQIILKDFKRKNLLKELFNLAIKKGIKLIVDVSPKEIR